MHEEGRREGAEPAPAPKGRDRRAIVKVVIGLILVILFIIFVAGNSDEVPVDLVFGTAAVRLIWVFVACALIGALAAYLLGRPGRRNTKRYIKELERRLAERDERAG